MHVDFKSKKQVVLMIVVLLTLAFIFGQSALPYEKSVAESDSVASSVDKFFDTIVNIGNRNEPDTDAAPPSDATGSENAGESGSDSAPGDSSAGDTDASQGGNDSSSGSNSSDSLEDGADGTEEEPERDTPFLNFIVANIRKIAHFMEHGILGLEIFFLLLVIESESGIKRKIMPIGVKSIAFSLNFGILAGFFDESIQLLSERGSQMKDVWLDISGYAAFTALLTLIYVTVNTVKYFAYQKREQKEI